MNDLLRLRLVSHKLDEVAETDPVAMVSRLLALQAQDFGQAKWALGSRLLSSSDARIDELTTTGKLIRSWFMRGTYQLVCAEDVRWLMSLTTPRTHVLMVSRLKELEVDTQLQNRCNDIFVRNLEGGKHLSRIELSTFLAEQGIEATNMRLLHIIQQASIDGIICASRKVGGDFGFTLYDEWIPKGRSFSEEEALAELARTYFSTRGPASLADFQWWTGLTITQCKKAWASIEKEFSRIEVEGVIYLFREVSSVGDKTIHLLSGFDEYVIAYRNRELFLPKEHIRKVITTNGLFNPVVLMEGRAVASWKRLIKNKHIEIRLEEFFPLNNEVKEKLVLEFNRYSDFMEKEIRLLT